LKLEPHVVVFRQFTGMPLELKETVISNKQNRDLQTLARFTSSTKGVELGSTEKQLAPA